MKVLVYPHDLGMGGSQLNAVELAAGVRDLGHEVVVYGRPGVLVQRVHELGLRFVESPPPGRRPSPSVVHHLRHLVLDEGVDLLHGYEWPPILECRAAALATPAHAVGTVMSMAVAPFLPATLPLVVGTRQIAAHERAAGRRAVTVIEPPVDLDANGPHCGADSEAFRDRHGIPDGLHVVVVTRLADQLKGEGLRTAIETVPAMHPDVVLTVVGDGPGRDTVQRLAAAANQRAGRRAVVLTGEVADPRPAYSLADVCLGMGGSALRALSFGAPLVVQGEQGFWKALTPGTLPEFGWQGWYGMGSGRESGPAALREALEPLLDDAGLRSERGAFSLEVVRSRFGLKDAAARQLEVYEAAAAAPPDHPGATDVVGAARFARYKIDRLVSRRRGRVARDDFNAAPVAATAPSPASTPLVVWLAGVDHDAVPGTEHRLVEALGDRVRVLWVDPPASAARHHGPGPRPPSGLTRFGPGRWRLHTVTVPGVTRPVLRDVARAHQARTIRRAVRELGPGPVVAVVGDPWADASSLSVTGTLFLCTDDFVAGAGLMGVDPATVRARVAATVATSDVVLGVSPTLVRTLGGPSHRIRVFPNGCTPVPRPVGAAPAGSAAVVVGQLNDRLDVALLQAVADRGLPMTVVGPRCERDEDTTAALDRLLASPSVTWLGRVPVEEVDRVLASGAVGLTPYRDTAFNRASFPLKTLEYLASGVPVVSTDLPASRWLDTPSVEVAGSVDDFVDRVAHRVAAGRPAAVAEQCLAVAASHSWAARAEELLATVQSLTPPVPETSSHIPGVLRVP